MDALDVVARLARVRERTRAELQGRLALKGFDPAQIDEALTRAITLGYVDDARAARALVERWRARGAARALLVAKLEAAGVTEKVAAAALSGLASESALAKAALERRFRGRAASRAQQGRFLASRGYDEALIEDLLAER